MIMNKLNATNVATRNDYHIYKGPYKHKLLDFAKVLGGQGG